MSENKMTGSGGERPVGKCMLCRISELGVHQGCPQSTGPAGVVPLTLYWDEEFCLFKHKNILCVTHFAGFIHGEKLGEGRHFHKL